MNRGSTIVGALLARRASQLVWRAATGRQPPADGKHPDVDSREALVWAVVGGGIIEAVRIGVNRWTATYWVRSTGHLPPGTKALPKKAATSRRR